MGTKQELIQEYVKCFQDTPYALRTYLETYDNTQSKHVPFELFPQQKEMVNVDPTFPLARVGSRIKTLQNKA